MSIYEENMKVIQKRDPELADRMMHHIPNENIYIGDAYIEGQFLAIDRKGAMVTVGSTYSPENEAERFEQQIQQEALSMLSIVVFGFGTGNLAELLVQKKMKYWHIIIYEPSMDIMQKILEVRDLTSVLNDRRVVIFVGTDDIMRLERYLDQTVQFHDWKTYQYLSLTNYKELYPSMEQLVREKYQMIIDHKHADCNTMVYFGKTSTKCEIHTFRYLMHSKSLYDIKPYLSPEIPCIIVAAGPSLEKNVKYLRDAKGKALIFCVDSAADYLVSQDIIPDLICTVDSDKQGACFVNERLHKVPIAVTTTSCSDQIDKIEFPEIMYFSSQSILHEHIFRELGYEMPCVYGGGSVALNIFELAVNLDFRTIIMIGQDLALTNHMAHAGKGELVQSDLSPYTLSEVEGYYGDTVITRSDFKFYIEWYNSKIPYLDDITVINATEGGAKLAGAVQMPLSEAIDEYCSVSFDFSSIYDKIPYIIRSEEQRKEIYGHLVSHKDMLVGLFEQVKAILHNTKTALSHLEQHRIDPKELELVNKKNAEVLDNMALSDASDMLYRYMVRTELSLTDGMDEEGLDPVKETMMLYQRMIDYQSELSEAISYQIAIWKDVLIKIHDRYPEL